MSIATWKLLPTKFQYYYYNWSESREFYLHTPLFVFLFTCNFLVGFCICVAVMKRQATLFGTNAGGQSGLYAKNPVNNFEHFMNKFLSLNDCGDKPRQQIIDEGIVKWNKQYKGMYPIFFTIWLSPQFSFSESKGESGSLWLRLDVLNVFVCMWEREGGTYLIFPFLILCYYLMLLYAY